MQIRTVRKPGERGTRRLVEKYRERLVCLRCRYDLEKQKRYKTVELIVAEEPWFPVSETNHANDFRAVAEHPRTARVPVRINYYEKDLQRQIKAIGGT